MAKIATAVMAAFNLRLGEKLLFWGLTLVLFYWIACVLFSIGTSLVSTLNISLPEDDAARDRLFNTVGAPVLSAIYKLVIAPFSSFSPELGGLLMLPVWLAVVVAVGLGMIIFPLAIVFGVPIYWIIISYQLSFFICGVPWYLITLGCLPLEDGWRSLPELWRDYRSFMIDDMLWDMIPNPDDFRAEPIE